MSIGNVRLIVRKQQYIFIYDKKRNKVHHTQTPCHHIVREWKTANYVQQEDDQLFSMSTIPVRLMYWKLLCTCFLRLSFAIIIIYIWFDWAHSFIIWQVNAYTIGIACYLICDWRLWLSVTELSFEIIGLFDFTRSRPIEISRSASITYEFIWIPVIVQTINRNYRTSKHSTNQIIVS